VSQPGDGPAAKADVTPSAPVVRLLLRAPFARRAIAVIFAGMLVGALMHGSLHWNGRISAELTASSMPSLPLQVTEVPRT
jgi:hypothetical protein